MDKIPSLKFSNFGIHISYFITIYSYVYNVYRRIERVTFSLD